MTNVMNMARLARIWVGGNCWTPIAWRRKLKTMMMRVKLVTVSIIAGARESIVKRKRISSNTDTLDGSDAPPDKVREREGDVVSGAAQARSGRSARMAGRRTGRLFHIALKVLLTPLIVSLFLRKQTNPVLGNSQ